MNLVIAVVIYQPDDNVLSNILSYINYTNHLYVIDNSNFSSQAIIDGLKQYPQFNYISMQGNKGIAAALNKGAEKAISDGAEYLMTMDQDSRFDGEIFKNYISDAQNIFIKQQNVAVIGINYDGYQRKHLNEDVEIADEIITSGMIINLEVMKKIGFFVEKLFIDYVDYEYCYRARKNGYICLMINKYKMQHQIGGMYPIDKFGIHFRNHNEHNSIRQYYMARNAIYIMKQYPRMAMKWIKNLIKAPIKILLVDDDKFKKFQGYVKGLIDGLIGRYGPKRIV